MKQIISKTTSSSMKQPLPLLDGKNAHPDAGAVTRSCDRILSVEVPPELDELIPNFNVSLEVIDPQKAAQYLEESWDGWPLNKRLLAEYAKALREGRCHFYAEGISFDRDGGLINGDYMLHAVVKTGIGVYCLVTRILPPEASR